MDKNFGLTCMEGYSKARDSWWVRIGYTKINGKRRPWFHKLFAYEDYGGKSRAKRIATRWRDQRIAELKTPVFKCIIRQDPFFAGNTNNNKWGKTGVHVSKYQYTDSNGSFRDVWEAVGTLSINKKKYEVTRSCWKYGEEEAVKLCIEWREKKEKELRSYHAIKKDT